MNVKYKVLVLWADGSDTVEYDGKWLSEAEQAGQEALCNGAIFADLYTYDGDKVTDTRNITREGW